MAVFSSGFFAEWLKGRLLCNQFPFRPPSVVQFFLIFFKSRQTGFNLLIFFFWIVEVEQRAMKNCSRWKMSQCDCYRFIICFAFLLPRPFLLHLSFSFCFYLYVVMLYFSYSLSQFSISCPHSLPNCWPTHLSTRLYVWVYISVQFFIYFSFFVSVFSSIFFFLSLSLSPIFSESSTLKTFLFEVPGGNK